MELFGAQDHCLDCVSSAFGGGAIYSASIGQDAAHNGPLTVLAAPGITLNGGLILHNIRTYDFDGQTAAIVAGNSAPDQLATVVPGKPASAKSFSDFSGTPTDDVTIGNSLVGFRTSSQLIIGQLDGQNSPMVTSISQSNQGSVKANVSRPQMVSGVVAADGGDRLLASKDATREALELVREDNSLFGPYVANSTTIADTNTLIPGGTGKFKSFFSPASKVFGSLSNGSTVFGGYDAAGEFGIYLKQANQPLRKVVSTTDTLDSKGIKGLQLANGNSLDEHQVAFLVTFDDNSQAVYVASFQSLFAYHLGLKEGNPDTVRDFPSQVLPAEIHGVAFNDANRNGFKDDKEPTLSNRTAYIDTNHNGRLDLDATDQPLEPVSITDAAGSLFFTGLDPLETYTIAMLPVSGFVQTSPTANNGTWIVTPAPGEIVTGINFGSAADTSGGAGAGSKLTGNILISANGVGNLMPSSPTATGLLKNVQAYLDLNNNGKFDPKDANGKTFEQASPLDSQGGYSFSGVTDTSAQIRLTKGPGMTVLSPSNRNLFSSTNISLSQKPDAVQAGQFFGPGKTVADLAVTISGKNQVWIYRNDGVVGGNVQMTMIETLTTDKTPQHLAVADFNKDGYDDLVVSNTIGKTISIFVNQKNPTTPFTKSATRTYFTRSTSDSGVPTALTIGDFDNDGYADIAVVNQLAKEVAVFLNDTKAGNGVIFHLESQSVVGNNPVAVAAGFFTGDNRLDLAVANNGTGLPGSSTVSILEGTGDGHFTTHATLPVADGAADIAATNLDADGRTDVVVVNYAASAVTTLRGQAGGTFSSQKIAAGLGPTSVIIKDIDNDIDPDILVSYAGSVGDVNHLLILRNQNGSFTFAEPSGSATLYPDTIFSLAGAQFDGNPGIDLALVNPIPSSGAVNEAGEIRILANQLIADGTLSIALDTPRDIPELNFQVAFPYHNVLKAADVTGDDKVALLDAQEVVNFINTRRPQPVPSVIPPNKLYYDVVADGFISFLDAQEVANIINLARRRTKEGEGAVTIENSPLVETENFNSAPVAAGAELSMKHDNLADLIGLLANDQSTDSSRRRRSM